MSAMGLPIILVVCRCRDRLNPGRQAVTAAKATRLMRDLPKQRARLMAGSVTRVCGATQIGTQISLHRGVKEYMAWWKPPDPKTGKTSSRDCWYCGRWYVSNIRGLPGVTMTSLKKALGASPERLRRHAEIIDKMIEQMIAQNLSRNSHIDFEPIHNEVLSHVTIDETAQTSPGKLPE